MSNVVVIGSQWGDEGKGKIVDWLSERADIVVRFQAGHNAGHTLVVDSITYKLSILPSGVVRANKLSLIGNGVVLEPQAFHDELMMLKSKGIKIDGSNLKISDRLCLILPIHPLLDKARELKANKIGTTGRGIGPAYEDKIGRRALRLADLEHDDIMEQKITEIYNYHQPYLKAYNMLEVVEAKSEFAIAHINKYKKLLLEHKTIIHLELAKQHKANKKILFEGAQGLLLDVDYGTYPFVTSSNTGPGMIQCGAGFGGVAHNLGITKAYTTRVGEGPFPSELDNAVGEKLGLRGKEFGTVTMRKRRCGWFDAILVRQSVIVAGINSIALTKLDVLDDFSEIKICTHYKLNGKIIDYVPANSSDLKNCQPQYETMPGWLENTSGINDFAKLPKAALAYIKRLEELCEVKISLISTSPKREDTILLANPFKD